MVLLLALLSLGSMGQAHAETGTELIERGLQLREQGRDAEALQLFEEAYRLSPSPRALAQIGLVQQALGEWVEAERRLTEALSQPSDPWIRRHRQSLTDALGVVRRRLGRLQVLGEPQGAEVRFGGQVVGTLPMREAVSVVAQRAPLVVSAPGHIEVMRTIEVRVGSSVLERVSLDAASTSSGSADPFDAALRTARDQQLGEAHASENARRVAGLRSDIRATMGVTLGVVILPEFAVSWRSEGDYYAGYGDGFSPSLGLDGGVRYGLSPRWELVARGALLASFSATTVLTIEAGVGGRVRPVSMLSPWFVFFELSGGAHVPLGTVEGVGFDQTLGQETRANGEASGSFFMGLALGTGFTLDPEERWDLSIIAGARIDDGHDEFDDMFGPYIALRLGHAF